MDSRNRVRFHPNLMNIGNNLSYPFMKLAVTRNVTGGILCRKEQLWNRVPLILKLAQQWRAHKKQEGEGSKKGNPDQTHSAESKIISSSRDHFEIGLAEVIVNTKSLDENVILEILLEPCDLCR